MARHNVYLKVRFEFDKKLTKKQKLDLIEKVAWQLDHPDKITPDGLELEHFYVSKLSNKRAKKS
jgi:hypothetical protein